MPRDDRRQQELLSVSLPEEASKGSRCASEIAAARRAVDTHTEHMRHAENPAALRDGVLHRVEGVPTAIRTNQFFRRPPDPCP